MVQTVRNLPSMQEAWVPSLAGEYPLEEGLFEGNPVDEGTNRRITDTPMHRLDPVFLPGESQGGESLVGCCRWGRTESDPTEAT